MIRGEKLSFGFGVFLKGLLALLLSFFILRNGFLNGFLVVPDSWPGWFFPMLGVYAVLVLGAFGVFRLALRLRDGRLIALCVFAFALILRLIVFFLFRQEPANDFLNYYNFGLYIKNRDLHAVALLVGEYQMPKMGGLALFNGLLTFIFTGTVTGQQLAHVVLSALICPVIFLVAGRLGKKTAVLSALLYALYPSSLISAQITTNQHASTLFVLLALHFFLESLRRREIRPKLLLAAASAVLLTISDFIHSSAIIALVAMAAVTVFMILRDRGFRLKNLCASALLAALFFSLGSLGVQFLYKTHVIYDTRSITPLFKVLIGFNEYTRGEYSEDYNYIKGFPFEEQSELCLKMLRDRLDKLPAPELLELLAEKTETAWFKSDLYFYFFDPGGGEDGGLEPATAPPAQLRRTAFTDGMRTLDSLFLLVLYTVSAAGLLLRISRRDDETLILSVLLPLGWMLFIMISEVQSRYRFPAIPFYTILAALTLLEIATRLHTTKEKSS